jgi:hypothetical protein
LALSGEGQQDIRALNGRQSASAQTLPISPKKTKIGRHKTIRTRADRIGGESLKSRVFTGVSQEKMNGLGLEPQSDGLPS